MERWGSRLGGLLALIGGAVGLGNFLRFPFQAAKYGGGAFLVPYLIALVLLAVPLVWIEMALGRPPKQAGHSITGLYGAWGGRLGRLISSWAVYVSLIVGSYYAYLTAWTLGYAAEGISGHLSGLLPTQAQGHWEAFIRSKASLWTAVVLILLTLTLALPIQKGLEKVSLYGMPLLFLLGIGLAMGAIFLGQMGACPTCHSHEGIRYLYQPRWEALTNPSVWLGAAGQVFFSVGVGFAMYPVYSSYYPSSSGLRKAGLQTVLANTLAEVGLGGLIVLPITTAFLGLEVVRSRAGFNLGFEVMPVALDTWGGRGLIVAWYALLFLAAFSSLVAMGLVVRTFLMERFGLSTGWTSAISGVAFLILGLPVYIWGNPILEIYDLWAGTAFLMAVAAGEWWIFRRSGAAAWQSLEAGSTRPLAPVWRFVMRFLTPLVLGFTLIGSFFTPERGDWGRAFSKLWATGYWPWGAEALPVALSRTAQTEGALLAWSVLILSLLVVLTLALREHT